ncbi:MAG: response regulator [Verrucomicrobiota bacterium]
MAKILLIEDAQTDSLVVNKMLKSIGHTVINADNGEDGLALVGKEMPDLIVSDIVMPKLDGFQVCRKVKRNGETKDIPVILVSSKSEETDKFWGMKQGASDYITKPIEEAALLASVGNALS